MSCAAPILVVDDEAILGAVCDALSWTSYKAVSAAHGAKALYTLVRQQFGLICDFAGHEDAGDGWPVRSREPYRAYAEHQAPIVVLTVARDAAQWQKRSRRPRIARLFELHLIAEVDIQQIEPARDAGDC